MYHITELVLTYSQNELDLWKSGDKSLVPDWVDLPDVIFNQPNYHFGEYYVLQYFGNAGWRGFVDYGIGTWEPNNPRYFKGRKKIEDIFSYSKLSKIREIRKGLSSGEPDVFLYRKNGETLFIEVKKENDRISREQLVCLGQIKGILESEIGVVYLKEASKAYKAKQYEIDIENYSGIEI